MLEKSQSRTLSGIWEKMQQVSRKNQFAAMCKTKAILPNDLKGDEDLQDKFTVFSTRIPSCGRKTPNESC